MSEITQLLLTILPCNVNAPSFAHEKAGAASKGIDTMTAPKP
ncbi:Unknown protein sequence [Pseudomonas amygdali pv. lachrymans]|uniref:Uncharacterized protein n=1 Tax=Pseudomonas amygdali pv. lachrymans TaxID=53707 RepID=A0ABR5L0G5_PSEAV|nr:Unknown protein sequence [Pseudomonas amygdali pv. lachrymans]